MKTIKIIIIITSIILIGLFFKSHFDMKSELKASRHNINELINETRLNKQLYLTRDQFAGVLLNENKRLLKQLKDSLNIKTKNIIRTVNNSYHYKYTDTIIKAEEKDSNYYAVYNPDECIKVDIKFSLAEKDFTFSNSEIKYESETVYYKERQTKKGKKIFWPFGKKKIKAETLNNCTGKTTTEDIIIQ